ncbi:hypothetical protein C9890_0599 [Perkinsus sp. BL_2016]|nr:hypothetical protein C9890_0599 [Perkinsus sp. BL_2016]
MEDIRKWSETHKNEKTGFSDTLRLIQQLERLRLQANQQRKKELISSFLHQMTRPKLWSQKSTGTDVLADDSSCPDEDEDEFPENTDTVELDIKEIVRQRRSAIVHGLDLGFTKKT